MAVTDHQKVMYGDTVKQLVGSQDRSLLKELVGFESKQGELVFLDAVGPDADAVTTAIGSTHTRARFEDTDQALSDWLDLQTPHMAIDKQRTAASPNCIDWGHHFDKETEILEVGDPKSRTMRQAFRRIWKSEDTMVIEGLKADQVNRGKDSENLSGQDFPSGQKLVVDTGAGADGSEDFTKIDLPLFSRVTELYETQYAGDMPVFLVIHPEHKRRLIDNAGGTLHSSDFVDKRGYFERGELPDIYGVHVLVHPLVTTGKMYAFSPDGITWNQFDPLEEHLGDAPLQRFHAIAYLEEYADCKRVDDNLIVQVTVQATE